MYLTETVTPLELVSQLLCQGDVGAEATARFADLRHNDDLCPGFKERIVQILTTYQRHRIDVHDVQGFHDKGVDVLVQYQGEAGGEKLGLQIKSYDEFRKWQAKRDPHFLMRLRSQCGQAMNEARADFLYLVLCTDAVAHRNQIRTIANAFQDYKGIKVVTPETALAFFRMDEVELDVAVTRILCARDYVLREAVRSLEGLPVGGPGIVLDLIFRALGGETAITHDHLAEILMDDPVVSDEGALLAALNGTLVEEVDVLDWRIVPDAYPAVCALYYDTLARLGGGAWQAHARVAKLLLDADDDDEMVE